MVTFDVFEDIMDINAAFSATDINKDHEISQDEIFMMLWVYEQNEPSKHRQKELLEEIDTDDSDSITRKEWLKYLCNEN